ncbi:MAG: PAS domain S-box protein [Thermodesulfobacteriota bacterium]
MKIKTKLQITTVVSLIVALVIGLILFFSARQVNEAIKKEKAADEIIRGLFELNILTNEYLIHHEERAKIQWQLKHDSIKRFLEGVEVESPEKIVLLKRMRERHKDIKNIFSQMVSNYEGYGDEKEGVSQELNEMLVGNLDAKSRSMVSDAYQLAEISSARLIASQQKAYLLVLLFSLIMAVVVATVSFSIHSGVVKPIRKLHEGTEIIGAGNLNYKVGTMAKDEVGQLSRAFDRMTIQLEESFAGLEKEIAERKEAEEALEESQKRYRQVVENAVEIIYSTDTNGNFTWANSTALKAVGYTLEELQRFNYLDFVVPEHRDRLSKIYISQFREKQPTTYVEFPFLNKSGEVMWFGQNASLVIEGGKVTGFHIIARDITERKRAEERLQERERYFRTLMYTLHEDIIVIDCDYRITDVNNTFLITTGSSREKVIGKHCYEISHGYAEPCDRHGEHVEG